MKRYSFDSAYELEKAFSDAVASQSTHVGMDSDSFFEYVFFKMFGEFPNFDYSDSARLWGEDDFKYYKEHGYTSKSSEDLVKLADNFHQEKEMDWMLTCFNLIANSSEPVYYVRYTSSFVIVMQNLIISNFSIWYANSAYKKIKPYIVYKDRQISARYVVHGSHGFETTRLELKHFDINISRNYNDDLPNDKILEFIDSDESGLMILNGVPGSGKTFYIRNLIKSFPNKDFLFLDNSVFSCITDSSFMQLLLSYKNSVIILEDCEEMLKDRISGNVKLSALLNLTDGIIGDAFNLKFICTFNADINNIDKALLRKGRLKLKYTFDNLKKEKANALAKSMGIDVVFDKDVPLCDVYHAKEQVEFNTAKTKKIGF